MCFVIQLCKEKWRTSRQKLDTFNSLGTSWDLGHSSLPSKLRPQASYMPTLAVVQRQKRCEGLRGFILVWFVFSWKTQPAFQLAEAALSMSKSCAAVSPGGHLLRCRAGTRTPAPGGLLGGSLPSLTQGSGDCCACWSHQHRCGASGVTTWSMAAMWNMKGGKVLWKGTTLLRGTVVCYLLPLQLSTTGQAVTKRTKRNDTVRWVSNQLWEDPKYLRRIVHVSKGVVKI